MVFIFTMFYDVTWLDIFQKGEPVVMVFKSHYWNTAGVKRSHYGCVCGGGGQGCKAIQDCYIVVFNWLLSILAWLWGLYFSGHKP